MGAMVPTESTEKLMVLCTVIISRTTKASQSPPRCIPLFPWSCHKAQTTGIFTVLTSKHSEHCINYLLLPTEPTQASGGQSMLRFGESSLITSEKKQSCKP